MSIESVKKYLKQYGKDKDVLEFAVSSATVDLASQALSIEPARIAKTLSFKSNDEGCILLVTAGDTKINNSKFKKEFGLKAKMISSDEVLEYTGHPVGGVCPFDNPENVKVFTDISIKRFNTLYPACGSSNSAIKLTYDEIFNYSNSIKWVDVCNFQ